MARADESRADLLAERGIEPYFVPDRECSECGAYFEVEEGWWCTRCSSGCCDDCAEGHSEECEGDSSGGFT